MKILKKVNLYLQDQRLLTKMNTYILVQEEFHA